MYRKEQYTEKTLENFKNLFEGKFGRRKSLDKNVKNDSLGGI
jgi:hypothetical protein